MHALEEGMPMIRVFRRVEREKSIMDQTIEFRDLEGDKMARATRMMSFST